MRQEDRTMKDTYTKAEVAEMIIMAMQDNDVEPCDTHTAAPGVAWGHVEAWPVGELHAIRYGDNGCTQYALTADASDLPCWLLEDGDGRGDLVAIANARDEDPEEAAEDYAEAVKIIRRRDYYGPTCEYEYVVDDGANDPQEWETAAEAREWIEETESDSYCTSHNEVGAPTYFVVPA
jgi:hypothetical protein